MAGRLHRGPAGQGHHRDDDGRRGPGAALGRRLQSFLRRGPAAQIDVRSRDGLGARMEGARAVLLRSGASAERCRRAERVRRRQTVRAVSAAFDSALLQPAEAEVVGRTERIEIRRTADGQKSDAVRRPGWLLRLRHVRRDLSVRRTLFAGLHVQAVSRAEENRVARSDPGPASDAR